MRDHGGSGPVRASLRILATSDLHVQIMPHDYHADRPAPALGLARLALLIAEERAGAGAAVLFDNGDFLQGNPMADYVAEVRTLAPGAPHPMIAAMNALGYDAATLGNHEFNYGLGFLAEALGTARFPVIASSLDPLVPAARVARPHAVLQRRLRDRAGRAWPLALGVIGVVPPQIMTWDWPHLAGRMAARGIVPAAQAAAAAVRAAGADIVVALCHSGLGPDLAPEDADPSAENAALALARLPGIDAVVAGHSHIVFPDAALAGQPGLDPAAGLIGGKPAVMPGWGGSHLGVIDLDLVRDGGGWRVVAGRGRVRAAAEAPPGAAAAPVVAAAAADHAATLAHIRRPVGTTAVPLHTYCAPIEPGAAVLLIAEAQRACLAAALAGGPHAGLPVVSAAAPFRAGGRGGPESYTDVPAGPLALRHLADLSPYPNTLCGLRLTGRGLRAWLEHAVSGFCTVPAGARDAPLMDPDWPVYNLDTIAGVTYTIDLARPAGDGRVRDLCLGGVPLAEDAPLILATNSYRAMGGGGFPGAGPEAVIEAGRITIRDALAAHLARIGCYAPPALPPWRLAPMPGTTVVFETGPGVRAHLAASGCTAIGTTPRGFLRLRRAL